MRAHVQITRLDRADGVELRFTPQVVIADRVVWRGLALRSEGEANAAACSAYAAEVLRQLAETWRENGEL